MTEARRSGRSKREAQSGRRETVSFGAHQYKPYTCIYLHRHYCMNIYIHINVLVLFVSIIDVESYRGVKHKRHLDKMKPELTRLKQEAKKEYRAKVWAI